MNHKRNRPKHQRAGCLSCKPWKDERGGNSLSKWDNSPRRRDSINAADDGNLTMAEAREEVDDRAREQYGT